MIKTTTTTTTRKKMTRSTTKSWNTFVVDAYRFLIVDWIAAFPDDSIEMIACGVDETLPMTMKTRCHCSHCCSTRTAQLLCVWMLAPSPPLLLARDFWTIRSANTVSIAKDCLSKNMPSASVLLAVA
jgi:hypothetical protein